MFIITPIANYLRKITKKEEDRQKTYRVAQSLLIFGAITTFVVLLRTRKTQAEAEVETLMPQLQLNAWKAMVPMLQGQVQKVDFEKKARAEN